MDKVDRLLALARAGGRNPGLRIAGADGAVRRMTPPELLVTVYHQWRRPTPQTAEGWPGSVRRDLIEQLDRRRERGALCGSLLRYFLGAPEGGAVCPNASV